MTPIRCNRCGCELAQDSQGHYANAATLSYRCFACGRASPTARAGASSGATREIEYGNNDQFTTGRVSRIVAARPDHNHPRTTHRTTTDPLRSERRRRQLGANRARRRDRRRRPSLCQRRLRKTAIAGNWRGVLTEEYGAQFAVWQEHVQQVTKKAVTRRFSGL